MILQALNGYYQRLLEDSDSGVAPPGYSAVKVSHAFIVSSEGDLLEIVPMYQEIGKKLVPKMMIVPEEVQRASNVAANFLYDNVSYVLGVSYKKVGKESIAIVDSNKFKVFCQRQKEQLEQITNNYSKAFLKFLSKWEPEKWQLNRLVADKLEELSKGNNIVFRLDGRHGFLHTEDEIKSYWEKTIGIDDVEDLVKSQCLITGEVAKIARTHNKIKGVKGAQPAGANIVSFNNKSFESYGKEQSYNAPVSEKANFAYTTALNYLLNSGSNKVGIGSTTMVFWSEKEIKSAEEKILAWSFTPYDADQAEEKGEKEYVVDISAARQAKHIMERIVMGMPVNAFNTEFDLKTRCYILGLAPNEARLSVRFWQINAFGELLKHIAGHYADMRLDGSERYGTFIPPWRILKDVAVQGKAENIPPLLEGQLLECIIKGTQYPQALYHAALSRARKNKRDDKDEPINPISVGIIKAVLLRKYRIQKHKKGEEWITMGLNETSKNPAYLLGRLFSLLEKVQRDALGSGINATIRDRYFGAASATPMTVFPMLIRLSQHHIAKSEYGISMDIRIQEVLNGLESFPAHLDLEEQGMFVLGYYHQNQANYTKKEDK